ncbi:MAG: hypothetical protein GY754_19370, partial [bacterium]|nr:hypothetical protein [bacterium]
MKPLNDAENYTRPSDVDDFATHAENYLAPRHHVPSVIDKVNDDEAMAAREKLTADTDAIVGGLSKNAPPRADYDYEEAVGGGQLFKPKEDGSIDYPNAHI